MVLILTDSHGNSNIKGYTSRKLTGRFGTKLLKSLWSPLRPRYCSSFCSTTGNLFNNTFSELPVMKSNKFLKPLGFLKPGFRAGILQLLRYCLGLISAPFPIPDSC